MASARANASVASGGLVKVAIARVLILGQGGAQIKPSVPPLVITPGESLPPQGSNIASLGRWGKRKSLDSELELIETPSEIRASCSSTLHI